MLASGSPQRRALLERLNVEFSVRVPGVDELEQGPDPGGLAVENALRKARAVMRPGVREAILGCDTIVVLDGVVYGKPVDEEQARRTLRALGGRTHEVLSGMALLLSGGKGAGVSEERTALARSEVSFRAMGEEEIEWYVGRGEWRGRSGGYAIQGDGARLLVGLEGEEENVVGLPLRTLRELYPELAEA